MIRLIVNADDYGRTAGINEGTIEAHLHGIVTSATVMILEGAATEGIGLALRRAPRLSLGLHCVLTGGGLPASDARRLRTLAPGGRFARNAEALPSALDPEEIRVELAAQIARFESVAGRPPSHLDSHHHSALHPVIQPVFAGLAAERGLPVRASSAAAATALRAAGVRTPDRFVDDFYAEGATAGNLRRLIGDLGEETTELMCHPGYPDAELLAGSTYASERAREVDVLCAPSVRALLKERGVELAAFDAL
ncbi:MAG: ChbG/HpnK family deacetylase [Acidobacteriota bacterium]